MTISIKPAEIVGAEIGDRVSWSTDLNVWYGTLLGLSREHPGRLVVEITHQGSQRDTGRRHIEPEQLTLAPKRYVIGDKVDPRDSDALPNGTTLIDYGHLPMFKMNDEWYEIDAYADVIHPRKADLLKRRTIAWMPIAYTDPR